MHCRALLLVAATAFAADDPTFHLDFTLVPVETRVYEPETGASISGLTASDFVLYDENSPREIAYFSHGTEPLDLVLLLDISGTMREVLEPIARQAGDALSALRSGDRASVMVFGKSVQLTQPLTSNFKTIAAGLPRSFFAHVGTDTDINNAVRFAAQYLRTSDRLARRAVLLVTDNIQATQTRDVAVERELFEAAATLDGIVISGRVKLPAFLRGHTGAYRFAQRTGGEVLEGRHPADDIARMIDRIRTCYTLYFRPAEGSDVRRRIRVELTKNAREHHPKAIVRARTYYFPDRESEVKLHAELNVPLALRASDLAEQR